MEQNSMPKLLNYIVALYRIAILNRSNCEF